MIVRPLVFICVCAAVNENAIRAAISSGQRDLETLSCSLGVAKRCQRCKRATQNLIDEANLMTSVDLSPGASEDLGHPAIF